MGLRFRVTAILVLSFFVSCPIGKAESVQEVLAALTHYSVGHLNGDNYHDATANRADYWDCNGYSVRACQILGRLGYGCQIAILANHALLIVSGKGLPPTYLEPQLGKVVFPGYDRYVPQVYSLDDYVQKFSADHCKLPEHLLPGAQRDEQVTLAANNTPPPNATAETTDSNEVESTLYQHNGTLYRCPKATPVLLVMPNGTLQCVTSQEASAHVQNEPTNGLTSTADTNQSEATTPSAETSSHVNSANELDQTVYQYNGTSYRCPKSTPVLLVNADRSLECVTSGVAAARVSPPSM